MISGTSLEVQWLNLSLQGGVGSIPGWEAKIPHALWPKNQNINNRSNILTNSLKTSKMVHIQKKNLKKKKWFLELHCLGSNLSFTIFQAGQLVEHCASIFLICNMGITIALVRALLGESLRKCTQVAWWIQCLVPTKASVNISCYLQDWTLSSLGELADLKDQNFNENYRGSQQLSNRKARVREEVDIYCSSIICQAFSYLLYPWFHLIPRDNS